MRVQAESIVCMQNLLRKYPAVSDRIIQGVGQFLKSVDDAEAKKALLWMLSEYGHVIPEAPYLLEPLIDAFEEETSQVVRLELLSSATKLFFRRPGEMQHMLGRLLDAAIADASFTDVHDRALLYYRLLQHDVHKASQILLRASNVDGPFLEEAPSELSDKIFEEVSSSSKQHCTASMSATDTPPIHPSLSLQFNTLSVIYGEAAERFITNEKAKSAVANASNPAAAQATNGDGGNGAAATGAGDDDDDEESSEEDDDEDEVTPVANTAAPPQPPPGAGGPMDDLLGLLDDLPSSTPTPAAMPPPQPPSLILSPTATLDAPTFQEQWGSLPNADAWSAQAANPSVVDVLVQRLAPKHVKCMAFGAQGDTAKFYFYGVEAMTQSVLLVELQVSKTSGAASATVKSPNPTAVPAFSALLKAELATP